MSQVGAGEGLGDGLQTQIVGEQSLCIRDRGQGRAVVLLHGTTATLGVWDEVVELLGEQVRTVAVDQRGHGRSSKPATGYGARQYVADVASLIRVLDCGPAVVVGHSLGARNAVVLGAQYPDLVAGVVAVDYTPFVSNGVLDALQLRIGGGDRTFASRTEVIHYLRERYPHITQAAVLRRAKYGYRKTDDGYRPHADPAAMTATVDGLRQDFAEATKKIIGPVTLVRGGWSRIVSADAFARTQTLRPDFRAVELPHVDHYIPEVRPDVIVEEVRRMLA